MYLVFENNGVIDTKAITTFGVSSKENDSAIGYFGTGLKYAIAILLREGCNVTIYAGTRRLDFGVKRDKVRVDEFDVVTMNQRRLGFTTELGKNWDLWQAFRELYCNCLDEYGSIYESEEDPGELARCTRIVIRGRKLIDVWADRSKYFIGDRKPLVKCEGVDIYPGRSSHIYYRGVRAYELSRPSKYTYDIQRKTDLSEDRTIKYLWDVEKVVQEAIANLGEEQKRLLVDILTTKEDTAFEGKFSYHATVPNTTFLETVGELSRTHTPNLNRSAVGACRVWAVEQLEADVEEDLLEIEKKQLEKAIEFCKFLGYPVDEYPIQLVTFLGEGILGMVQDDKILVSKTAFLQGTKRLAGTLLEEYIHIKYSMYDYTATMQNFLVDAIISAGELAKGEPL